MSILIKGMKMPKDCPKCPMAHYDALNHFRGCEIVPRKRHAINDPNYANTSIRPDWCPLIELPPHGRLIDADALKKKVLMWLPNDPCGQEEKEFPFETDICVSMLMEIKEAPTVIPADKDGA